MTVKKNIQNIRNRMNNRENYYYTDLLKYAMLVIIAKKDALDFLCHRKKKKKKLNKSKTVYQRKKRKIRMCSKHT